MERSKKIQKLLFFETICFWVVMAITTIVLIQEATAIVEVPNIAWVLEALTPDFWEDLKGGSIDNPTDFLTNH